MPLKNDHDDDLLIVVHLKAESMNNESRNMEATNDPVAKIATKRAIFPSSLEI